MSRAASTARTLAARALRRAGLRRPTGVATSLAGVPHAVLGPDLVDAGRLHTALASQATEHGPVLQQPAVGGAPLVYLVGPEAARFVLHTHRHSFSNRRGWDPLLGTLLGHGLIGMDDPEHPVHRRLWNPAFVGARIESYLPVVERLAADHARRWAARDQLFIDRETRTLTFEVVAATLAGYPPSPAMDRVLDLLCRLLFQGFDPALETRERFMLRVRETRGEKDRILLDHIQARRDIGGDRLAQRGAARDLLDDLLQGGTDPRGTLSDQQILGHLDILLVAGNVTTTILSAWVLYLIATHPAHRARLRDELRTLPGGDSGPITLDLLRRARTLDLFVREAGRLYSPLLQIPREAVQEVSFAGHTLPAGTRVHLALAAGHLLPAVFEAPGTFDPDRFAPPREEDRRTPYGLITFGAGPRACIGASFAQTVVKVLAIEMLRHYEMEAIPGQRVVHAGYWLAYAPEGIRMRIRPRAPHPGG